MNRLVLESVSKVFTHGSETTTLFEGLSSEFTCGTSYALMGPSGTGKSTLLLLLAGLEQPTTGSVFFNSLNLARKSEHEMQLFLRKKIGFVFQAPYLVGELSVLENVMLKGLSAGEPYSACVKRARVLLEHVGLESKAHVHPKMLSGGEQQRVAIARALFYEPLFLLADEPTAHLDGEGKERVLAFMNDYYARGVTTLVLSTHDTAVAHKMDTIFTINNGRLIKR